ncbi:MAG: phosphatase PAP2 family protein [Spirochaetia bacterium]|nr:phosphatase PAP2 family protein [Spirochaetia bacterium]
MQTKKNNSFSLPDKNRLKIYFLWILGLDVVFVSIYGGMNYLASLQSFHYQVYLVDELKIPFIPFFIYLYLSISFLFIIPLFRLTPDELHRMGRQALLITLTAGLVFYLFPTVSGYQKTDAGIHSFIFKIVYLVDRPHNLFPSLHVAYTTLIITSAVTWTNYKIDLILWIWYLFILSSVLLVHQHHLADIPAGILLAHFIKRLVK